MHSTLARMAARGRTVEEIRARMPQSSYYKNAQPGAALQRARRAYLIPNAITGICIFTFAIGVYAFTIKAVGQDEFSDVPIPDAPMSSPGAPHTSINRSAGSAPPPKS